MFSGAFGEKTTAAKWNSYSSSLASGSFTPFCKRSWRPDGGKQVLRQRAERSGKRLDLTPKEFRLLSLLARCAGEVLSRTLIAEQVWDMNFDSDTNVVDVHVRRLRAKVDDPFPRKLIHTVRGVGYVLENRDK